MKTSLTPCISKLALIAWATFLFLADVSCGREGMEGAVLTSNGTIATQGSLESRSPAGRRHDASERDYVADCNDPDTYDPTCVHLSDDFLAGLRAYGYPYYVGHAEAGVAFYSSAPNSGFNMQWKLQLPATDPTPTQSGSSIANFELFVTDWFGLVVCDPTSAPYGSCTPDSDSNNPSTAGSSLLELQLYPPGSTSGGNLSNTQWTIRLTIWSAHANSQFVAMNCGESVIAKFVTINGDPAGSPLFMSNGDSIVVTIKDTTDGLSTTVNDLTSGAAGFMVASAAKGFIHNTTLIANGVCSVTQTVQCTVNADCPSGETCVCQMEPFTFHPMYATASPGQGLGWGSGTNVSFVNEIGHWELCGDATCSILPDGDGDDMGCTTVRGVGGCTSEDTDTVPDGVSFQPDWPDGSPFHPAPMFIGSSNNTGVGPLSPSTASGSDYSRGYGTVAFGANGTAGNFYPFFSAAGAGTACRFTFGNDIPNVTTNDFGKIAQYGTTMNNPCYPGIPAWIEAVYEPLL